MVTLRAGGRRWFRWSGGARCGLGLGLGLILAAGLGGGIAAGDRPPVPPPAGMAGGAAPVPVAGVAIRWSRALPPVEATGVVVRKGETVLSFKVAGVVERVGPRLGGRVRRGEVLACLQMDEVEAQQAQAQAAWERLEQDHARARRLLADRVITEQELQAVASARDQAAAAVRAAEFNRRHAVIEAPVDGWILRRLAEPHQTLPAGAPVLGFAPADGGWVIRVALSEADLEAVAEGAMARVEVAGAGAVLSARLVRVAGVADPLTHTTEAELELSGGEPPPERLRSGFLARVSIECLSAAPVARVPAAALVEGDGQRAHVFLLEEGRARRETVRVLGWDGDWVRVGGSLPEAGRVVTRGAELIREGQAIREVPDVARR